MKEFLKKILNKKTLMIAIPVTLLVIAGIIALVIYNANKSYRIIKLEECEGNVEVKRSNDPIELFSGLQLINGDVSSTGDESLMTLLIDTDKHMSITPNTVFEVKATGTDQKGSVKIDLKSGKAIFEVENKLNESSTFEVNTPNATTSIRGTTFTTSYDPGSNSTHIFVSEGTVSVSYGKDQTIELNANEYVTITNDEITERGSAGDRISMQINFPYEPDYLTNYHQSFSIPTEGLSDNNFIQKMNKVYEDRRAAFEADARKVTVVSGNITSTASDARYSVDVTSRLPSEITADLGNGMRKYRVESALFQLWFSSKRPLKLAENISDEDKQMFSNDPNETFADIYCGTPLPVINPDGSEYKYTYYHTAGYNVFITVSPVTANDTSKTVPESQDPVTDLDPVPIDAEHFPDEVFRKYLKDHHDDDGDGILSGTERNNVFEICLQGYTELPQNVDELSPKENFYYNGVERLDGIEYFPRLHLLAVTWQNVSEVDLSRNKEIDTLVVIGCKNRKLDISGTKIIDRINSDGVSGERFEVDYAFDPNSKIKHTVVSYAKTRSDSILSYDEGTEIITGGVVLKPAITDRIIQ